MARRLRPRPWMLLLLAATLPTAAPLGAGSLAELLRESRLRQELLRASYGVERGETRAQFRLGKAYLEGEELRVNRARAVELLAAAARQGHGPAALLLARILLGEGDRGRTARLFLQAGSQGNPEGYREFERLRPELPPVTLLELGEALLDGTDGMRPDSERARDLLSAAAESGVAEARYRLGMCWMNAEGGPRELDRAVALFRQAAEQGHVEAQYELGYLLRYRLDRPDRQEWVEGRGWLKRAMEGGHARAPFLISFWVELAHEDDPVDHAAWLDRLRLSATRGHDRARFALGFVLLDPPDGSFPPEPTEGARLIAEAARDGWPAAMFVYAAVLAEGKGVPADPEASQEWLERAADAGDPNARFRLGRLAENPAVHPLEGLWPEHPDPRAPRPDWAPGEH